MDYNKIIKDNMGLVHYWARHYSNGRTKVDDLIGPGMEALWKAAKDFDPSYGRAFAAYATPRIRIAMTRVSKRNRYLVTVPYAKYPELSECDSDESSAADPELDIIDQDQMSRLEEEISKLSPKRQKIIRLTMRGYSQQEIASDIGCSRQNVRAVMESATAILSKAMKEAE